MSEKVKEIRAKKLAASSPSDVFAETRESIDGRAPAPIGASQERDHTVNPTVEAALARVRRAGLVGSYDAKALSSPQRGGLKAPVGRDRAATATALEPLEEPLQVRPAEAPAPAPAGSLSPGHNVARTGNLQNERDGRPRLQKAQGGQASVSVRTPTSPMAAPAGAATAVEPSQSKAGLPSSSIPSHSRGQVAAVVTNPVPAIDIKIGDADAEPIDEIEPLDYLEAEVRKVDEKLSRQEIADRAPGFCRAVSGVIDMLTILVTALPFVGLILFSGGSLTAANTRIATGAVVVLIALFYLALTQSLSGKTFGMMVTNTRVVQHGTHSPPPLSRVLMRSLFYLVSIAPAAAGILWIFVDRKGRAWHDLLSGTAVIRDF